MSEITLIRNNDQLTDFQSANPDGYVIMDGDKGVGLIGTWARAAKNNGSDPMGWIRFANELGPQ